jgi:site-specific recombinase XerD
MSQEKTFKFTKTSIAALPLPSKGKRVYVNDSEVKGLTLMLTATGHKSFYLRKNINKIKERILIGKYPDLPLEEARKITMQKLNLIAQGVDLVAEKRRKRDEMTLGELFHEYMERYSKPNKKSWMYDQREITKFLSHWFPRKLSAIEKSEIRTLHEKIHKENGLYQANRMLERIRAMYNKAIEWDWPGVNPTLGIKKYREKSRDRFIQPHEMPHFMYALNNEENTIVRDFFWILLLTGARKTNTLMMRFEEISWEMKSWRIPNSKNGEALVLPLIDRAIEILKARRFLTNSEWVFPGIDPEKHYSDPKRAWRRTLKRATISLWSTDPGLKNLIDELKQKIDETQFGDKLFAQIKAQAKIKGVVLPEGLMSIRLHDVRRTLGSYQAINGSSLQVIGQSLGHKSLQSTQVYSRLTIEPVRTSVEEATRMMFEHA